MFLNWGFALSARNVLSLVRLGFLLLSFWRGMILKLLLLGVLVDRLVALDAVEVVGCCIVFRESWGVVLRLSDSVSLLTEEIFWYSREIFLRDRSYAVPRLNSITARDSVSLKSITLT